LKRSLSALSRSPKQSGKEHGDSPSLEARDRFGNAIDPEVKYARGQILASARDERLRFLQAQRLIRRRLAEAGPRSIAIFTGNQRDFLLDPADLGSSAEEWLGPAQFNDELRKAVLEHLGGANDHEFGVFNRTTGGLIAAISAIGAGRRVVSYTPAGSSSHPSITRGARAGGSPFIEVHDLPALERSLRESSVGMVVITPVSSELKLLTSDQAGDAVGMSRRHGAVTLVDDAYGARLRPVVQDGPKSLELGADLAITSADKAGLAGPRAGLMAGRADLVLEATTRAAENGQEARAPIALAILRSLERYTPANLTQEIAHADEVYLELAKLLPDHVHRTPIGAFISEEDILLLALERAGVLPADAPLVPCEAASALGMILLREHGILVIVSGQPGSRVSLRLKPIPGALDLIGGAAQAASAVNNALDRLAEMVGGGSTQLRELIVGGSSRRSDESPR
jgi:L-seryl-tRNA(Ser) seleniumtransferase